jgi:hypothetical protein
VTAPDARDELRELLREHTVGAFAGCDTACACDHRWRTNIAYREHLAEVVTAYAERRARVKAAEEIRKITLAWQWGAWADMPATSNRIANGQYVTDWLRNRADALAADDQPDGAR